MKECLIITINGRSLRIFKADSHSSLICCSKLAIRSHIRVYFASFVDVLQWTRDQSNIDNNYFITNQLSFLKSIRTAIGTSKSISTITRTTQLTRVSTGGSACNIKLKLIHQWWFSRSQMKTNKSYIKIKEIIPKITNGSYWCSHSSKLFNGNKILRHMTNDCLNSSVRYLNSFFQ